MAKKNNAVTLAALKKAIKENSPESTHTVNWNGLEITVKNMLTVNELIELVNDVVGSCFLEDGTYVPELVKFLVREGVISHYTNLTMPKDIAESYEICMNNSLYECITKDIIKDVWDIEYAVEERIAFEKDTMANSIKASMQKFVDAQDKLTDALDGFNAEDLNKMLGMVISGGFSEEKIVQAYMDQTKSERKEIKRVGKTK